MADYFLLLNEPRRPWIDPVELKQKFHSLSVIHHPDRSSSDSPEASVDYSDLNAAYNCLRDTPQRLAHLIELETGEKPPSVQSIPGELMDWAFEAGALLRETDQFLAEKARNSSPMVAVQLFEKGMQFTDRLAAMQARIQQGLRPLDDRLREMNAVWPVRPSDDLNRASQLPIVELAEIYQRCAFLNRWGRQIQERVSTLAI
jgi:curved DNA-binding protein CbpA